MHNGYICNDLLKTSLLNNNLNKFDDLNNYFDINVNPTKDIIDIIKDRIKNSYENDNSIDITQSTAADTINKTLTEASINESSNIYNITDMTQETSTITINKSITDVSINESSLRTIIIDKTQSATDITNKFD